MDWHLSPPDKHRTATIVDHTGRSIARVYGGDDSAQAIINHRALALDIVRQKEALRLSLEYDRLTAAEMLDVRSRLRMLTNLIKQFHLLPDVAGGVVETSEA